MQNDHSKPQDKKQSTLINQLHLSGRIATDPTQSGKGPTKFRLAHGGGGKKKDGSPWPVQWFSVACWDKTVMQGVVRGTRVEIFGKLRDSTFTNSEGVVKYGVEIVAETIVVEPTEPTPAPLTPTTGGGTDVARSILRPAVNAPVMNQHGMEITDDDIPF